MSNYLTRMLSSVAQKLNSAPPDSRMGRSWRSVKAAIKNEALDAMNVAEFADLSEQERMLADQVRVDTYAAAISRQIGPDDVVVDLGAGTGILSFLASRRARKVYAVEHSAMIDVARTVGDANGLENIEYIHANSREFTPPEPVDVILHEQIGDELLEENMIENVVDLRERVLRTGGRIVPAKFELYLEPVELLDAYSTPYASQMNIHGIDYSVLGTSAEATSLPRRWDLRWQHRLEVDHLLCSPEPVYHLDLHTVAAGDLPRSFHAIKIVTEPGRMDGLFLYFRVIFDEETEFDTAPSTRTSWGNRLFRVPPHEIGAGEEIEFHVELPDARHVETWLLTMERPDRFRRKGS